MARVGHARALEIALPGRADPGRPGAGLGPDQPRWSDDELLPARVAELAARLAAGPPGSLRDDQAHDQRGVPITGFEELLDLEAVLQQERAESTDFVEGVMAFVQKRPADFTGT